MPDPVRRHSFRAQQQCERLLVLTQIGVRTGSISQVSTLGREEAQGWAASGTPHRGLRSSPR